MWCGEVFHGLGVQGVKVLILLGALFPPSMVPVSQQGFGAHTFCFYALVTILDLWSLLLKGFILTHAFLLDMECVYALLLQ
jgi:hypothetical protein